MFKITRNTIRQFTLAEILVMAAMNEIDAAQGANAHSQEGKTKQTGVKQ